MVSKSLCVTLIGFAVLYIVPVPVLADKSRNRGPKEVITKAIEAHGGKRNLAKLTNYRTKDKGTIWAIVPGRNDSSPVSMDYWYQYPDRIKYTVKFQFEGQPFSLTRVFDGQKAWMRVNDKTIEQAEVALEGWRHSAYVCKVKLLYPLLDEAGFALTGMQVENIEGRPASCVKVTYKGRRDIKLYFDNETSLLVKTIDRYPDDDGKEALSEELLSGHKSFEGLKHFTKHVRFMDGIKNFELETISMQFDTGIQAGAFARP